MSSGIKISQKALDARVKMVYNWEKAKKETIMNERKFSFSPIINASSRTLILGSLPGADSLRLGQYYANPRNAFWRLFYALFDREPDAEYSKRCDFILENNFALWDICGSAERGGSADSKITKILPNDIAALLTEFPVSKILLNGRKAESEFFKNFGNLSVPAVYVPSTSPALAALTFEEKLKIWKKEI
ncbi:MAG: DNA-deoxyinosine glycosylase [Oscillospiraceae bacterium]|jgi:hypoxanthine-DNA glycosylase|nr:DNA-deoxyinosine glycosylase [Oscillospiraceae bacterium]